MTIKQLFKGKNKHFLQDFLLSEFNIKCRHIADTDIGTIIHKAIKKFKVGDSSKQSFFIAFDYHEDINVLLDFLIEHDIPWLLEYNMNGNKDIKWITFYEKIHLSKE